MAGGLFAYVWAVHLHCSKSLTCKSIIYSITFHIQPSLDRVISTLGSKEEAPMIPCHAIEIARSFSVVSVLSFSIELCEDTAVGVEGSLKAAHILLNLLLLPFLRGGAGRIWALMIMQADRPTPFLHFSTVNADEALETRWTEYQGWKSVCGFACCRTLTVAVVHTTGDV